MFLCTYSTYQAHSRKGSSSCAIAECNARFIFAIALKITARPGTTLDIRHPKDILCYIDEYSRFSFGFGGYVDDALGCYVSDCPTDFTEGTRRVLSEPH